MTLSTTSLVGADVGLPALMGAAEGRIVGTRVGAKDGDRDGRLVEGADDGEQVGLCVAC